MTCNGSIQREHFADYVLVLNFTHAVSYLFTASIACLGKTEQAWTAYADWMRTAWQGNMAFVIAELKVQQSQIGDPSEDAAEDDPREQLRRVIGYLENNRSRMKDDEYRKTRRPTTSAWMESAVKEMKDRIKGTEMFWNNPAGAEAILQIRSAALSDDDRLVRLMTHRPGKSTLRRASLAQNAAGGLQSPTCTRSTLLGKAATPVAASIV